MRQITRQPLNVFVQRTLLKLLLFAVVPALIFAAMSARTEAPVVKNLNVSHAPAGAGR